MILGFQNKVDENCALLGYYTVSMVIEHRKPVQW